jgi:uncharacterized membrane protein YGL010W
MTKDIKIIILFVLWIVAIAAMCVSQTFPRDSLSHYLCWIATFIGAGYAVFFFFSHFPDTKE